MSQCNCDTSHDSSGFTSGLLLGLMLGGAGGYLLSTDKGKELLSSLKDVSADKLAEIVENPVIKDKLAELESAMSSARATLESSKDSARDKVHQVATEVAEVTRDQKPKRNLFSHRGTSLK